MSYTVPNLAKAVDDLKCRSLSALANPIAKLLYVASSRDYNTGMYYHDGLAFRFSSETASQALREVHLEIFEQMAYQPLDDLVDQVDDFMNHCSAEPVETLRAWRTTHPYRVLKPADCDPLAANFFYAQIRTALEIVATRAERPLPETQSASRQQ